MGWGWGEVARGGGSALCGGDGSQCLRLLRSWQETSLKVPVDRNWKFHKSIMDGEEKTYMVAGGPNSCMSNWYLQMNAEFIVKKRKPPLTSRNNKNNCWVARSVCWEWNMKSFRGNPFTCAMKIMYNFTYKVRYTNSSRRFPNSQLHLKLHWNCWWLQTS